MRYLIVICALIFASPAWALNPDERLADPALEERARTISKELRCLVCQNQSIDDSDAELARDLRVLVRERLVAGDSDNQVLDFAVDRYGEFVLLRPRLGAHTILLWGLPALILLGGIAFGLSVFRKRSALPAQAATSLSSEEQAMLEELRK